MAAPALIFVAVAGTAGDGAVRGWAIPTATDIAFALAVLAVIGTHLPAALRTFLLTLAVVDDLFAITIIAVFYTRDLQPVFLLAALVPLGAFTVLVQRRVRGVVTAAAARLDHVGVGARVGGAPHRRRGPARFRRPGPAQPRRGRSRRRPRAGRALRTASDHSPPVSPCPSSPSSPPASPSAV